jgi:hypothetical protein
MRYENGVYLLPAEVEPAKGNLGSLASVEEEKIPLAP